MFIDFLTQVFHESKDSEAIVWNDKVYSYQWLLDRVRHWRSTIRRERVEQGAVAILESDFSPNSIALFLALIDAACIVVPLTSSLESKKPEFIGIAEGEVSFAIDDRDDVTVSRLSNNASHEIYATLREIGHPGLVVFSSGSTGKSKAVVHDMAGILEKFKVRRRRLRAITFLLYDHLGGVNTMLYQLSNGGCIITVRDRSPDAVLSLVERYKVELLPTSPTFINLILLSGAIKRHDLSSLRTVSYGTEPMPQSTLKRFHELLPQLQLQQTYGLTETGVLRSKSKSSDSLWVRIGGEGFETRVVDGILQIKAESAMLGYLNAPSPFTEDGWLSTGDLVEVDGEFIRFFGRESEIINVGGEKVYPAEVEGVIQEMDNVAEATVYGESNPIVGNIVCASVTLVEDEDGKAFARSLKKFCREKLASYKVPVKVAITEARHHSDRFKKIRSGV